MTAWINSLAAVLVLGCLYQGLPQNLQKIAKRIVKPGLLLTLMVVILLCSWCAVFFSLMGIPLENVRPLSILTFAKETAYFDSLTNLKLWAFPSLVTGFALTALISPYLEPSWRHLYGDAHWATKAEISKLGFLNEAGNVIIGNYQGQLLRYQLTNHLLVFAPSRSGKGVSIVIPNALAWQGSLLCLDNKYEIFNYTSGYRAQQGNRVYRFSPAAADFKTHRINPLDYVNRDNISQRITDLHLILDVLIANSGSENQMWAEEARSLALGILLWLMQSDRPFTLGELSGITKGEQLEEFLTKALEDSVIADNLITLDHAAYIAIRNFLQKAPKEQSGVRSTLAATLRLWEDPLICAATSQSDVDFRDMRKRPITLYLSFGTDQISRLAPLINIIVQLFLKTMLKHLPEANEPCKVLCLLDEINRFGRMEQLKDGFGDLAGYGVHLIPVIQNIGQFYSTYGGRDNTDIFFQNTDLKIAFRQNAQTDKKFVSDELGNKTVRIRNRSYSTNREGSSYSESLIERPLLTPKQVGRFSTRQQMVICGDGTIKCNKIIYFKDKQFKSKILPAIPVPEVKPQFPIIAIKKPIADAETAEPFQTPDQPNYIANENDALMHQLAQAFEEEGV